MFVPPKKTVAAAAILAACITTAWLGIDSRLGIDHPHSAAPKWTVVPYAGSAASAAVETPKNAECCGGATAPADTRAQSELEERRAQVLAAFDSWAERYARATPEQRTALVGEGVALAQERRPFMVGLIKSDPREAIEAADRLSPLARKELPAEVAENVERMVSAKGDLAVLGMVGSGGNAYLRQAQIGGEQYTAFTYGKRLAPTPESNVPLIGVSLPTTESVDVDGRVVERKENLLALREDKFRVLSKAEIALERQSEAKAATRHCPVSGDETNTNSNEAAVDIGGEVVWLCKDGHVGPFIDGASGLMAAAGGDSSLAYAGGPGEGAGSFPSIPSGWATGSKTVVAMPVRFPEQAANPFGSANLSSAYSTACARFKQWSYNRITVSYSVTPILTLPHSEAEYASGAYGWAEGAMMADAVALANAAGYNAGSANFRSVVFTGNIGAYGGLAYVVGRDNWIKSIDTGLIMHEIGHNLGLPHANSWTPLTSDPIGAGSHCEYCGSYNAMGDAYGGAAYDTMMRFYIRWLTYNEAHNVSASGTYRIYDPEVTGITSGRKYTIRIPKQSGQYYFVEFRPRATALSGGGSVNATTASGIRILRTNGAELLDVTPGSANGTSDAALAVGQSFTDTASGITISPVLKGGSGSSQYMNVTVTFTAPTLYSGGVYELQPQCAPGLALDVSGAQDADGADVNLWTSHGGSSQQWKLEDVGNGQWEIIPLCAPGRRLEVSGTNTDIWGDWNGSNQRWALTSVGNGYYELTPAHATTTRLDVANSGTADGTNVQIHSSNGSAAQRWRLLPTGPQSGATYTLEPACAPGKCLAVSSGANSDGADVLIWDNVGDASQQWTLEDQGDGNWELIPQCATGRRLEAAGWGTANGTNILIWSDFSGANQQWSIVSAANGYYELVPKHAAGSRCDVSGAGSANGTDVHLWQSHGGTAQRWRLFRN